MCYFESGNIVLMIEKCVALGRFLEVKPNKREMLVRTVTLKTRFAVLKRSIGEIVLLKAPRLDESS